MVVLFIDMDYFFAACEELRHPELKGRPFVVGTAPAGRKEHGVVETCNYETRKLGIHSAMPLPMAFRIKPDLAYVEADDKYYMGMSEKVMDALKRHKYRTEIVSIDEAALDLGGMDWNDAEKLAKDVKSEINGMVGLPCTVGVSTGKVYAKMVCDTAKPNGIGILKADGLKEFLKDRKVEAIVGVGHRTAEKLRGMRIDTIGKLAKADPNVLIDKLGAFGKELYQLANGIDESKVEDRYSVLSIGRETTLARATTSMPTIMRTMKELALSVTDEVKRQQMWFKGVSVKARYADLTERIKNRKLSNYSDSFETAYGASEALMKELVRDRPVRKVGVRVYSLAIRRGQRSLGQVFN